MSLTDDQIQNIHGMYANDQKRFEKFLKKLEKIAKQWTDCNYNDYISAVEMSKNTKKEFKTREKTIIECGEKLQQLIHFYKTKEHY